MALSLKQKLKLDFSAFDQLKFELGEACDAYFSPINTYNNKFNEFLRQNHLTTVIRTVLGAALFSPLAAGWRFFQSTISLIKCLIAFPIESLKMQSENYNKTKQYATKALRHFIQGVDNLAKIGMNLIVAMVHSIMFATFPLQKLIQGTITAIMRDMTYKKHFEKKKEKYKNAQQNDSKLKIFEKAKENKTSDGQWITYLMHRCYWNYKNDTLNRNQIICDNVPEPRI